MNKLFSKIFILYRQLKRKYKHYKCKHEFPYRLLTATNIQQLEEPVTKGYKEWIIYYSSITRHPSHTHRVKWQCHKCFKVFYAHYGLDILRNGKAVGPLIERV